MAKHTKQSAPALHASARLFHNSTLLMKLFDIIKSLLYTGGPGVRATEQKQKAHTKEAIGLKMPSREGDKILERSGV